MRIRSPQGVLFNDRTNVKCFAVVTNEWEMGGRELIEWQRGKAGTAEHVNLVIKDELAGGVYPSGEFGANAAGCGCRRSLTTSWSCSKRSLSSNSSAVRGPRGCALPSSPISAVWCTTPERASSACARACWRACCGLAGPGCSLLPGQPHSIQATYPSLSISRPGRSLPSSSSRYPQSPFCLPLPLQPSAKTPALRSPKPAVLTSLSLPHSESTD